MISSFAASVGLAACNDGSSIGNNTTSNESTTSNHTSSNSTVPTTETHSHNYNQKITTEKYKASEADCEHAAVYHYACTRCGKVGEETYSFGEALGHDYSAKLATSDRLCTEADHHNKATYYYSCSRCGKNGNETFEYGECIAHTFDQQVVDDIYKASDADCEHAATYYYSCICGDSCSETFEHGDPLGHDYSNWSYHYRETVDGEDKKTRTCSRCDRVEVVTLTNSQSVQNLIFEISEDQKTCKIIGYKSYYDDERDKNIVIPEIWNGYSVTSIGESAFSGCSSLTSIVIPDSVTSIGGSAFLGCDSLAEVYYTGTEEQWNALNIIGSNNESLTSAIIHYNYKGE